MRKIFKVKMLTRAGRWGVVALGVVVLLTVVLTQLYFTFIYAAGNTDQAPYISTPDLEGHPLSPEQLEELAQAPGGRWQPVTGTRHKFYVYSAHHDAKLGREVRIVGVTRPDSGDKVYCQLFYKDSDAEYVFVPATVQAVSDSPHSQFVAVSVVCPLPGVLEPWTVSVVSAVLPLASNLLRVQTTKSSSTPVADTIAACVPPVDNTVQIPQVLEFIEMNTILGVNHFLFYNQSASVEVGCLLTEYAQRGRATLLQWNYDVWSRSLDHEVRPQGDLAAYNDCLRRTSRRYAFTALLSLHEYIVPRRVRTLQQLIQSKHPEDDTGVYLVKTAHFFIEWPDGKLKFRNIFGGYMTTLFKVHRAALDSVPTGSVSVLCRPEAVLQIGPLRHLNLVQGYKSVSLDESEVTVHTYHPCESGTVDVDCSRARPEVDLSTHRHAQQLMRAMLTTWNQALPVCTLHDTAQPNQPPPRVLKKNNEIILE